MSVIQAEIRMGSGLGSQKPERKREQTCSLRSSGSRRRLLVRSRAAVTGLFDRKDPSNPEAHKSSSEAAAASAGVGQSVCDVGAPGISSSIWRTRTAFL